MPSHPPNEPPFVSIAMCTYNGERFVRQQLDSLIAQSYRPIEIIIQDDCSTDSTREILKEYEARHACIHLGFNEVNLGYCRNFEKALGRCSGQYIALCDQDDVWFPEKIETFVREIGGRSLIYSVPSYIDGDGVPIAPPRVATPRPEGRCPLGLLFSFPVTGHLSMIDSAVLKHALPFPDAVAAHDYWVTLVASALGGIKPLDAVLSHYRVHGGNVSLRKRKRHWNPIRGMLKRREVIASRINRRIALLEYLRGLMVLADGERDLVGVLADETKRLESCFINFKLRRILMDHKDELLPYCKKPSKMALRLSRGIWYYRCLAYLNRA